jgi:hypothetical protein
MKPTLPKGAAMTSVTAYPGTRELAYRSNDGMDVALLWHTATGLLSVVVDDSRTDERFELVLDHDDRAMDVFHHPFAYAARRGLEFGLVSRDEELVAA